MEFALIEKVGFGILILLVIALIVVCFFTKAKLRVVLFSVVILLLLWTLFSFSFSSKDQIFVVRLANIGIVNILLSIVKSLGLGFLLDIF